MKGRKIWKVLRANFTWEKRCWQVLLWKCKHFLRHSVHVAVSRGRAAFSHGLVILEDKTWSHRGSCKVLKPHDILNLSKTKSHTALFASSWLGSNINHSPVLPLWWGSDACPPNFQISRWRATMFLGEPYQYIVSPMPKFDDLDNQIQKFFEVTFKWTMGLMLEKYKFFKMLEWCECILYLI